MKWARVGVVLSQKIDRQYDKPGCDLFSVEIKWWESVNEEFSRINLLTSECDHIYRIARNISILVKLCVSYVYYNGLQYLQRV